MSKAAAAERTLSDAATTAPATPAPSGNLGGEAVASQVPAPRQQRPSVQSEDQARQMQEAPAGVPPEEQKLQVAQLYQKVGLGEGRELIVARGMTRQQAAELQTTLQNQRYVQRAAVYGQAGPQGQTFDEPAKAMPAQDAPAPRGYYGNAPAEARRVPATLPSAAAANVDATTRPYALGAAVTTQPADAAKQMSDLTAAAAPATLPAGGVGGGGIRQDAALALPATRPADTSAAGDGVAGSMPMGLDADERVDVVIVVQDDLESGVAGPAAPAAGPDATVEGAQQAPAMAGQAEDAPPAAPATQPAPSEQVEEARENP
jgi:hypothetical protein